MNGLRGHRMLLAAALFVAQLLVPARFPARATPTEPGAEKKSDWTQSGFLADFSLGAREGPIRIRADQLEFDYKNRVVVYRGAVEVTQGDTTLNTDKLTVYFDERAPERERLKEIVAEGNVRIGKGARFATGGHAVFDQATRTATLSRDAVLHDGPNSVAGERVVVYLAEGRSVVEGGDQQVHAVLVKPEPTVTSQTESGDDGNRQ